ncbi:Cullin-1, partial [Ananas comosus]
MDESIGLEEGWEILEEGIAKAVASCAFRLGIQSFNYCEVIYDRYKSALEQIVTSMVLPSLMGKRNEFLLQELLRMWSNYQKMTIVTSEILAYLDRHYVPFSSRPPLKTVAAGCFFNLVRTYTSSGMSYKECLIMESERAARYLILSRDFQRHYFVQSGIGQGHVAAHLIDAALVEAFENAFRTKMTTIALRAMSPRNYPTWTPMIETEKQRNLRHMEMHLRLKRGMIIVHNTQPSDDSFTDVTGT